MEPLSLAFISAIIITIISLTAAPLLLLRDQILRSLSIFLVALASSALLGTAFLHTLPEVVEEGVKESEFLWILAGFAVFYLTEKVLHLHHVSQRELKKLHHIAVHKHGEEEQEHGPRELGVLGLLADFFHNFIDGIILAAAFIVDIKLGLVTAIAIALHEIPQEIAIFGVLFYSGFARLKALSFTFLAQTSIILGVAASLVVKDLVEQQLPYVLLFTVGSFVYLGAADFVPEFRKEKSRKKSFALFLIFLAGLLLMWSLKFLE